MKRFLFAAMLFLVPALVRAQTDNRSPYYRVWGPTLINTRGYSDLSDTGRFALQITDSTKAVLLSGTDTTGIIPKARAIIWRSEDSSFYYGDGVKWNKLTGQGNTVKTIDTVGTISSLENYSGSATVLYVTDTLRGGLFSKQTSSTNDNVINFPSSDNNTWHRNNFNNILISWGGASKDSSEQFNRQILDSCLEYYPFFPIYINDSIQVDLSGDEIPSYAWIYDLTDQNIIHNNVSYAARTTENSNQEAGSKHVFVVRGYRDSTRAALYLMPKGDPGSSDSVHSKIDLFLDDYDRNDSLYRTAGLYSHEGLGTYKQGIYAFNSKVAGNYWFANPEWWQTMRDLSSVSMKWMNYSTQIPDSCKPILPWQPTFQYDSGEYVGSLTTGNNGLYQCISSGNTSSTPLSGTGPDIQNGTAFFKFIKNVSSLSFYNQVQISSNDLNLGAIKIPNLALVLNGNAGVTWGRNISWLNSSNLDDSLSIARQSNDLYLYSKSRGTSFRINPNFFQFNTGDVMINTSANNGNPLQVGGNTWLNGTLKVLSTPIGAAGTDSLLIKKTDGTIGTISPNYYTTSVSQTILGINGVNNFTDTSLGLGGQLTQTTNIYGSNAYDLNLYPAHLNIGNIEPSQTSSKVQIKSDSTGSGPNIATSSYFTIQDPTLSNAWGYNALYGVTSLLLTTDPVPTSQYTFLSGHLSKFDIPQSDDTFHVNSSQSPISSYAALLGSENGNIGMSDFAWFDAGASLLDPVKNSYTGKIDTAYGFYLRDILSGQMGDSIKRAYGIYLQGFNVFNYLAGHTGFGINTSSAAVDINGTSTDTGADLLRIRKSFTPTGTDDAAGQLGSWAWDDNYIYVKTSAGWKRAALTTF